VMHTCCSPSRVKYGSRAPCRWANRSRARCFLIDLHFCAGNWHRFARVKNTQYNTWKCTFRRIIEIPFWNFAADAAKKTTTLCAVLGIVLRAVLVVGKSHRLNRSSGAKHCQNLIQTLYQTGPEHELVGLHFILQETVPVVRIV